MWLENLVDLKRREGPPPPLPEKQEAFTKGFSFYNDIRPPSHLAKMKFIGIPGGLACVMMLPIYSLICLSAWLGRPGSEVSMYFRWISIGFLVLFPIAVLLGLAKGYRMRRRRWEFWEWPDFASFTMEEADAQKVGTLIFSAGFIIIIGLVGWAVR